MSNGSDRRDREHRIARHRDYIEAASVFNLAAPARRVRLLMSGFVTA